MSSRDLKPRASTNIERSQQHPARTVAARGGVAVDEAGRRRSSVSAPGDTSCSRALEAMQQVELQERFLDAGGRVPLAYRLPVCPVTSPLPCAPISRTSRRPTATVSSSEPFSQSSHSPPPVGPINCIKAAVASLPVLTTTSSSRCPLPRPRRLSCPARTPQRYSALRSRPRLARGGDLRSVRATASRITSTAARCRWSGRRRNAGRRDRR